MKKVELLSPAGNFDCLKAAINNGADAVYLGGDLFSARAFANNFNDQEMVVAVNYAHLRNVKVYVTLNTLLNEYEIDNAYNKAKFYYEHNIDALIIQDLGLFYRLRKDFPDFELHASTQMHIHNVQGVINAEELGFKRVVVARESSLEQIKQFTKQDIEIECFVHGAICVSYSGQCLMSSVTKKRSANKGMCAQCCRLKYNLYQNDKKVQTDTEYLLSPKDMYLLEDIPDLIAAGVTSFKIEGRMKSAAYVGYVTRIYRKAIDNYYENKEFHVSKKEIENLKLLYNRGFTNTYLKNLNSELFSNSRPNHMGVEIGKVIDIKGNSVFIKLNRKVNQFDGIRIVSNEDTGLILNMLKVNGKLVSSANENEIIEISLNDKVNINDIVLKTIDYQLEKEISETKQKLIPINLKISIITNQNIRISCSKFEYISNYIAQEAIKQPITKENLIECFNKTDTHPYCVHNYEINLESCFVPLKILNEIRRDFYEKYDNYVLNSFRRLNNKSLYLDKEIENSNEDILVKDFLNPVINIDSIYNTDKNLVSEFGGILLKGRKDAYYTLNICNSYAYEFLLKLGFFNIVLSSELNPDMINGILDSINSRLHIEIKPYIITSGKRTLMYISRDPFSKYITSKENFKLSDSNNIYSVCFNDKYVEIIDTNDINIDINDIKFYKEYRL